jgi:hypothetical protein
MGAKVTLHDMKRELLQKGIESLLRGGGAAEFLFAERQGRAVELSQHAAKWWVEFWEANEDEEASSVSESFYAAPEEAIQAAVKWLLPT